LTGINERGGPSLSLSLIRTKLSLDFLPYCLGVNVDLSLNKTNMKGISFMLLYTKGFFPDLLNYYQKKNNYPNQVTQTSFTEKNKDENRPYKFRG